MAGEPVLSVVWGALNMEYNWLVCGILALAGFIIAIFFATNASAMNASAMNASAMLQTIYCANSVLQLPKEQQAELLVSDNPNECVCWEGDVWAYGDWIGRFCKNGGFLEESRLVKFKSKPDCKGVYYQTEYHNVLQDFCKKCPEPKPVGDWAEFGCINNEQFWKRSVQGFMFSPLVSNCYEVRLAEFKREGVCVDKESALPEEIIEEQKETEKEQILQATGFGNGLVVIIILFAIIIRYFFVKARRKKVKK